MIKCYAVLSHSGKPEVEIKSHDWPGSYGEEILLLIWPMVVLGLPISYLRDIRNPERHIS
jgi:hypothetical protein